MIRRERGMGKAEPSGISLTEANASIAKGMLGRGDRQHDIAAWFGVIAGRIADIATGKRFRHVVAAPKSKLPRRGHMLRPRMRTRR